MKLHISRHHLSLILALFILFLAINYWPAVAKFITTIMSAVTPLLVGCVIAYLVNLLLRQYERLYRKLFSQPWARRYQRLFGIVLSYCSIIIIITLVIRLVIPELTSCIRLLFTGHNQSLGKLVHFIQQNSLFKTTWQHIDLQHLDWQKVGKLLGYGVNGTIKKIMSTATSIISTATTAIIAIFFSVYLLIYKEKLARQFYRLMDTYFKKIKQPFMHIIKTFDQSYSNYIVGQCKDAAILGIACFIGMKILGMPYASMIGVVTFFGALIPIIGAILGASIGVILIFAVSPFKSLIFLIFIIVLQQFDNRITYPLVVGKSIGLPSVWVFAAVIVGGGISGVLGMMLTVPLFAAIYKLVAEDVQRRQTTKTK